VVKVPAPTAVSTMSASCAKAGTEAPSAKTAVAGEQVLADHCSSSFGFDQRRTDDVARPYVGQTIDGST
jgi:hypothetical protein